jgi:hypothetical protein
MGERAGCDRGRCEVGSFRTVALGCLSVRAGESYIRGVAAESWSGGSWTVDRRVALAREWDELMGRALRLGPEVVELLAPPRLAALLPGEGTAVVVNPTSRRSDALLVSASGVASVPLPDLDLDELFDRAADHLQRLQAVDTADARVRHATERAMIRPVAANYQEAHAANLDLLRARDELDARLLSTLEWLWSTTAEPVLTALGAEGSTGRGEHRVWWCPTGPMTFLPVHAAGHHDGSGRSVIDRVVSSTTPTLHALTRASRPVASSGPGRMLVVAVDDLPGQPPLRQAADELELLRELFPADRLTVIEGPAATRAAVLAALPDHRWVHFSCHGSQDMDNPSNGGLLLADGTLTVLDLIRGRYRGDFAFLSACMTATGGVALAEEVVTLAAGLHYTGFRHVLATLWSVDAELSADLAHEIFPALFSGGRFDPERSAVAAADAVLKLRAAAPARPSLWAPFVHTGP